MIILPKITFKILNKRMKNIDIEVIDLFCWVWWLSHWLLKAWLNIVAWVDFEGACKYWFEYNNKSEFIQADIRNIQWKDLKNKYSKDSIKVLAWCAPCQPFSTLNVNKNDYLNHEKAIAKSPLDKFASLIEEIQPDIVTMENVRGLAKKDKYPAFKNFLETLEENNYFYTYKIVDSKKYWIPQNRFRLVLIASKLWEIELIPYTHEKEFVTVRDTIGELSEIKAWEISQSDTYHRARKLSNLNMKRIKSMPKNGWNLVDGDSSLMVDCHKKDTWKSYMKNIYARMRWDEPSPTMTTQCIWIWNGRFWHPEQNRWISLREAARFQTFPDDYKFVANEEEISTTKIAKQIWNAVPVKLWEIIWLSINEHLKKYL